MITRKQYMDGEFDHTEYYGQFVTPELVAMVRETFRRQLLANYRRNNNPDLTDDPHFNDDIPLRLWDRMAENMPGDIVDAICEANKSTHGGVRAISLSDRVCALKAAGRVAQVEIVAEQEELRTKH